MKAHLSKLDSWRFDNSRAGRLPQLGQPFPLAIYHSLISLLIWLRSTVFEALRIQWGII